MKAIKKIIALIIVILANAAWTIILSFLAFIMFDVNFKETFKIILFSGICIYAIYLLIQTYIHITNLM